MGQATKYLCEQSASSLFFELIQPWNFLTCFVVVLR